MTVIESILSSKKVIIVGHQRPDGDCLGSGLALRRVCEKHGVAADFVCDSPAPAHYAFLPDFDCLNRTTPGTYDMLVTVDCADNLRLGKYCGYLKLTRSVNIDHHKTNNGFAKENVVRRDASSTCEIMYEMLKEAGEIDKTVAYLLFAGLSTDTGHFMHSNTTPAVFRTAAELCEYGIDVSAVTNRLYKSDTLGKIKLIARAINSMRFFADGKLCIITVTLADLSETGCVLADTEGIIDYGMKLENVEVAVCVCEQNSPAYKVSFRSKSVDVAAAAAVFGGGGHVLAAGCSVSGKYEDVIDKLVKSVTDGM